MCARCWPAGREQIGRTEQTNLCLFFHSKNTQAHRESGEPARRLVCLSSQSRCLRAARATLAPGRSWASDLGAGQIQLAQVQPSGARRRLGTDSAMGPIGRRTARRKSAVDNKSAPGRAHLCARAPSRAFDEPAAGQWPVWRVEASFAALANLLCCAWNSSKSISALHWRRRRRRPR